MMIGGYYWASSIKGGHISVIKQSFLTHLHYQSCTMSASGTNSNWNSRLRKHKSISIEERNALRRRRHAINAEKINRERRLHYSVTTDQINENRRMQYMETADDRAFALPSSEERVKMINSYRDNMIQSSKQYGTCFICGQRLVLDEFKAITEERILQIIQSFKISESMPSSVCSYIEHMNARIPLPLRSMVCNSQGFDDSNNTYTLCNECATVAIDKKKIPKCALVRGLFIGVAPLALPQLTIIEEMLLALVT